MAKIAEVRLTLAAFIYSIEMDLKNMIKRYIVPFHEDLVFFKNKELEEKAIRIYNKENPGINYLNNLEELVDFIDFQDSFTILLANEHFLPARIVDELKIHLSKLCDITPIRNRVMHTRPLLSGDFGLIYDYVLNLKHSDEIPWILTLETRNKIEHDPLYVLTLSIPFPIIDDSHVIHNLPIPDFDETGFVGRSRDVEDVKRLILSNKVVSIIGDGGIGKTALALKVVYDIIDMKEHCPFEFIIWTSAKTTMLTAKGIEEINTTLKDFTGFIDFISSSLEGKTQTSEDKIEEILEYLTTFKTLLVIDNLETIQTEDVRDFIREAQMRCNIVITSRIGLGELEFPRKLVGLSENESAKLVREIARVRNSETLMSLPQATLIDIASKLYFNPLALKWFVNTVETGIPPAEVLLNKDDLLNFCLSNVYDKLSENSIKVLNTIRAARKHLNTAEIIFLSSLEPLDVRKALNELFSTTLISRSLSNKSNIEEISYYITDFANDFLLKEYPLNLYTVRKVTESLRELNSSLIQVRQQNENNEFSINSIPYKTSNEKIAAKFLTEALSLSRINKFDMALKKVEEAKNIVPNYAEAYRVGGFIKGSNQDILAAEENYLTGLEIEPENPRLLFYYSQLLLFQIQDVDRAFEYAEKVYYLRPDHPYTIFLIARCYANKNDFKEAIYIINKFLIGKKLSIRDRRIANSDLIRFHYNYARNLMEVEKDYLKAINLYKNIVVVFDRAVNEKNIDDKLVKSFCESMYSFVHVASPVIDQGELKEYLKKILIKYDAYFASFGYKYKIVNKFNEKFNNAYGESLSLENSNSSNKESLIGKIIKRIGDIDRFYVFIETKNDRYFAHKNDFLNVKSVDEWRNIKNGQIVSFELGENANGVCAKNIRLLN